MQTATHTLADLVDLARLQRTCDSFAAIGDIVLAVLDLDGTVLVSAGWQDICTCFHRVHTDTLQACRESDRQIDRRLAHGLHGPGTPEHYAYRCANGLWDIAFPLVIAGEHLGNVFTGQFFYDDDEIDVAAFRSRAQRLGFDEAAYLEALARVPVLSHERVAQTIRFLADFVGMLGELGLSALRAKEEGTALRESEAKYHDVVERANDGIAILQGGLVVFANEALGHILGYSVGELTGRPFLTLVREDQRALVAERARRRLAGEELSITYVIDLVRKDAVPSTAEASGGAITYRGAPADLMLLRDVSERKRLEDALRRSEAEYRRIVETALEGIIVLDSDARMTLVNQQIATRLGYAVEEMVGRPFEAFLAEDQRADHQAQMTIRARGDDAVYERCFRCKDGGESWALVSAKTIVDPAGRREGSFATLTDITARKQVEEALRASEARYRSLFEDNHAVMLLIDPQSGGIVDANPAACAWYGWGRDEMLGMRIDQINTLSAAAVRAEMEAARAKQRRVFSLRHRRADGSIRDVEVYSGPIELQGKTLLYSLVHDVSERTQGEVALRENEEKFRFITENVGEVVWTLDPETLRFTSVSPSVQRLRGYTPEEVMAEPMDAALTPEGAKQARAQLGRRIAQMRASEGISMLDEPREMEQPCKDGSTVWTEVITTIRLNEKTGRPEVLGLTRDITARKHAEDELRETRDYLENLFSYANAPIIVWDAELRITRFNHAFEELTGRAAGEVVGEHLELLFPEDERRAQTLELVTRASAGERWQVVEIPILREDGEVRTVLWNSATLYADDGTTPVATIAQGQDISARKRAEEALARLNDELLAETAALAEANATITRIAATDDLTGLANRRQFYESLEKAISLARRHGSPVALVALDLDGLKRVNDSAGHEAGDEMLTSFAALLAALCRAEDVPARLGGDEFNVLLPGIERVGARGFAERVRAAVRSCEALEQRGVTVSAGVVQWSPDDLPDDLLRRADEALYAAKRGGGDAVAGDAAAATGEG